MHLYRYMYAFAYIYAYMYDCSAPGAVGLHSALGPKRDSTTDYWDLGSALWLRLLEAEQSARVAVPNCAV